MYSATSRSNPWHCSGPNGNGCGVRGTSASNCACRGQPRSAVRQRGGLTPATARSGRPAVEVDGALGLRNGIVQDLRAIRRFGRRPLALRGRGDGVEVDLGPRLGLEERLEPLRRRRRSCSRARRSPGRSRCRPRRRRSPGSRSARHAGSALRFSSGRPLEDGRQAATASHDRRPAGGSSAAPAPGTSGPAPRARGR